MTAATMRENAFRERYRRYIAGAPEEPDLKRKTRTAIAAKMARVVHALIKQATISRITATTGRIALHQTLLTAQLGRATDISAHARRIDTPRPCA